MMRPASVTVTTRLARKRAISGAHSTSTNCAPWECSEKPFDFGSSQVGCVLPSAPAITAAVCHAPGVRVRELPVRIENLLQSRILEA